MTFTTADLTPRIGTEIKSDGNTLLSDSRAVEIALA